MKLFLLRLKYWLLRCFYGSRIKPCPDCGLSPVISIHHDNIKIACKNGCHSVSMSEFNSNFTSWAKLVWQWNHCVDTYQKNCPANEGNKQPEQTETLGFGQYFIEHPVKEDKS